MKDDEIIPEIGQHVKCLLTNNTLVEGFVMIWDLHRVIKLKSLDSESILIIHHPDKDIMMTKVILDPAADEAEPKPKFPLLETENELKDQWTKTYNSPSDELRTKKLAELKILMIEQEKKIVRNKVRSHSSAYVPHSPNYLTPDWSKVPVPKSAYQPKKIPRK